MWTFRTFTECTVSLGCFYVFLRRKAIVTVRNAGTFAWAGASNYNLHWIYLTIGFFFFRVPIDTRWSTVLVSSSHSFAWLSCCQGLALVTCLFTKYASKSLEQNVTLCVGVSAWLSVLLAIGDFFPKALFLRFQSLRLFLSLDFWDGDLYLGLVRWKESWLSFPTRCLSIWGDAGRLGISPGTLNQLTERVTHLRFSTFL